MSLGLEFIQESARFSLLIYQLVSVSFSKLLHNNVSLGTRQEAPLSKLSDQRSK